MRLLQKTRPLLLSLAILAGLGLQSHQAHAATAEVVVAGGCFWCVESDFERVQGVKEVISGYTGGTTQNPTYKQVTRGGTGHYEAVRILYDPNEVSLTQLYHLFFRSVDPTDAGGQFCDRGESYRTAIFVSDSAQKTAAERAKANAQNELGRKIVTPILSASSFYEAEDGHQDYYKGKKAVLTRFGAISQRQAYKRYRKSCGRDARIEELWGEDAPFIGN